MRPILKMKTSADRVGNGYEPPTPRFMYVRMLYGRATEGTMLLKNSDHIGTHTQHKTALNCSIEYISSNYLASYLSRHG